MHTFSHSPESIRDLQPNPSDKPEIVAVLRGNISAGTQIEMLNVGVATPGVVSMWESKSPQEAQICSKIFLVAIAFHSKLRVII